MPPTVGGFRSPSPPAQRSYFQNPNPSVQKHPTDSAGPTVRRKPVKMRKQSSCSGSVRSNHVNRTDETIDFVFNSVCNPILGKTVSGGDGEKQSIGESLDLNMLQFTMGSAINNKSAKKVNSEEVQKSGNDFQSGNLEFAFSTDEMADTGKVRERGAEKFGKFNGLDFVFGANVNNGVVKPNSSNFGYGYGPDGVGLCVDEGESNGTEGTSGIDGFIKVNDVTTEADSLLAKSISGLNLGTGEPCHAAPLIKNNNTPDSTNSVNLDFEFSADHRDIQTDLNYQKEEFKETVDKLVSDGKVEMKLDANLVFGTSGNSGKSTEGLGTEDFRTSSTEINSGDSVNRNVDGGTMFFDSKVNGLFHIGNQNQERSNCKGRRKLNKQMNNLKKQDKNVDSVHDGNYSFIFGSCLGNAFSDTPKSKVFDESKTSNIHGPTKINTLNNDSCSYFNNSFVFGSEKRNPSNARSDATTLNQCKAAKKTDEVSKVSGSEEMGKSKQNQSNNLSEKNSDEGQCYQNQLKTEAELIKETAPSSSSSTINLGFVPQVHYSEAPPTNEAGITNNFNFSSNIGVFGTSFTGFNTPDINLASAFTTDMFPGVAKKLKFSKSNSVAQRKLNKAKEKLRQQGRNRQQGGCNLSKEVPQSFEEASGCSPMDFSPYGGAECVSTSTDPATSQGKTEDAVDTTENLSENNFSSSSATSFAGTNVSARQRPRKKYITKTGQGLKFTTPKASRAHEFTSGKHTKASDQEICDKWRERGNQAYKNGDLSEAEGCYSKGISSIQHTETPGFCIEPLLLCYSNRAAARMALGRLREGLKDCSIAASLDPTFVKANLRSANCHLLLGELEDASYNYNKCLKSENIVCLDRRLAIEAADGLQKAQKVANYLKQSAELLQQKTHESATNALGIIADALSLSCYSEKLLNMKGEALFVLRKHKDVVQLCELTLASAEKNFATESKLWRWNLMSKSYFHLGRLEMALDFIEKHEQSRSTADESVDPKESLNPLAVTIRELLHFKNAGNEAFQNGKHTEAIEHYSAAISKSMESHSFAAVCFCNRAAAHQSLGEIIDAIGDCSTAIALDGTYPKALSRRSTLWEMIRDYKNAADDLQRFISILETRSGENSQKSNGSMKDLRKARRRLSSIEDNSKKERSLDLYLILGIKPSDAAAEVKKAYRKAALRHHPDKAGQVIARAESGSDGQKWKVINESIQMDADKLFKLIGEAYAVLSDSTKRSKYDLEEEMWEDMNTHASSSSSSRRASDFYHSPFETTNRRDSYYSTKTHGNYYHYYWGDSRNNCHNSHPRW
ncbi:hypothetical protein L1987_29407 [Smallanthus sonchifolius]|uniref:Uncharacterized protein n=1 Tax=Smallanthus sonchifolius TaxID=185202 RepID=A0ACB9I145_9ASTR|nr:hypothetical protein L1987_29407 [Smallanthus sonchifolius]